MKKAVLFAHTELFGDFDSALLQTSAPESGRLRFHVCLVSYNLDSVKVLEFEQLQSKFQLMKSQVILNLN